MCVSVCVFRAQRSNFLINWESEAKQLYVDFREKQFFFFFFFFLQNNVLAVQYLRASH